MSRKLYKLVANGVIVAPCYYRSIINEFEKYYECASVDSPEKNLLLLRKQAHILDKGVQRKSAEPGHGTACRNELASRLKNVTEEQKKDPTVIWASNVAEKYDALQKGNLAIHPAMSNKATPVAFDSLLELMMLRRSNRCFRDIKIQQDVAQKMICTINWAASSCNKQPVKCFFTLDPAVAQKALCLCKGGTGFDGLIPSFWCFCADSRGYVWPTEATLPYIDVALGAQNFFLAATTLGVSGTILSWAQHDDNDETSLRKLLNIPSDYVIAFCAVMGYAEYEYETPARKLLG